jgi:hypothetical protein
VSRLRARCPDCDTLTAVALGAEYQCHSCGREFAAAVVRLEGTPQLGLPYPEAAVAAIDDPDLAGILPQRPIVLGGDEQLHERVRAVVGPSYLFVPDEAALAARPSGARLDGVGFAAAVAVPDNAAAIARFLAALGL